MYSPPRSSQPLLKYFFSQIARFSYPTRSRFMNKASLPEGFLDSCFLGCLALHRSSFEELDQRYAAISTFFIFDGREQFETDSRQQSQLSMRDSILLSRTAGTTRNLEPYDFRKIPDQILNWALLDRNCVTFTQSSPNSHAEQLIPLHSSTS